jgi:hypothetical protein
MVWRKIPKAVVTKKEYQQSAIYGLYIIVGLGVLAWLIQHFKYIG